MGARTSTALGLLAAAVLWAACSTTQRPVSPHELDAVEEGQALTVERVDGGLLRLRDVAVTDGRLVGWEGADERLEIPLDSVRSVTLTHRNVKGALALIPVVAVGIWLQHGASTAPSPPPSESCPFVYVHDGQSLVFQAEPYGGAIVPALERTEWSPLPALRPVDGEYRLRIANELDETQHIDEARLVVVDHPAGTRVAADAYGGLHVFERAIPPTAARDSRGRDLTAVLRAPDRRAWLSSYDSMDAGIRETLRDPLVVEFPRPAGARAARLLVNGATSPWGAQVAREFLALRGSGLDDWYRSLESSGPELAGLLDWFGREGLYLLPLEVETSAGWEPREVLFGSGPFAYRTTAYSLDVSDLPGETLRVRLRVPVGFWVLNSLAVSYDEPRPARVVELETKTLEDARGRALRSLLSADDGRALVLAEQGEHVDLVYPVPPPPEGARTVFLKITGHYEIHLQGVGEPDHATLERVLEEPGYTLRFAHERYLRGAGSMADSR